MSNASFRLLTTCALAVTLVALACGAVALYNVAAAAVVSGYAITRPRVDRRALVLASAVAASAWWPPLAYVGFAIAASGVAFLTWFAWCFRMTRLF